MYVYSYYNKKVSAYEDPFLSPVASDLFPKLATRSIILEPNAAKKAHRYECDLYYLGTFDEVQGIYSLLEKPSFLCSFSHLEVKENEQEA